MNLTEYRFLVQHDDDYNPADNYASGDTAEDEAYLASFLDGTLDAFGLILEHLAPVCGHCGRGGDWEVIDSLWGIDLDVNEQWNAHVFPILDDDGNDTDTVSAETATAWTTYLGDIARDMLAGQATAIDAAVAAALSA